MCADRSEGFRSGKVGRGDSERGGFAEQFDEYERPLFAIGHLVDRFKPLERPRIDGDRIPWGKQALGLLLLVCAANLQGFHQPVLHMGRLVAEGDQPTHAPGGPERGPTFS